jgi:putative flippase GtrA
MEKLLERLLNAQFLRYFAASAGALAVDMGSFLLLLNTAMPAGLSAALAYMLGMVANWFLLSRSVFEKGTHDAGPARTRQKALFLFTTWGGLAATTGIVSAADLMGADVRLSKAVAVAVSFVLNYFVRKHYVFTAGQAAA